jgi:type I restriction enzyme S subunit
VEQRRIVDILNHAASIRRLREQAKAKAKELIPALLLDMFGDLRLNVRGFPARNLREVADIGSGITKGRKLKCAEIIEVPYLRVANVQDGFLDLGEVKKIHIRPDERQKYGLRNGDLLMTEGGDPDKLGRAALWQGEIENCVHQNHVFRVRSYQQIVDPIFLRALAGSSYGKHYFLRVAKRTTGIASINKTQLGNFPVLLPPLAVQRAFAERVADIQATIDQMDRAAVAAEQLQSALMARVFAGG